MKTKFLVARLVQVARLALRGALLLPLLFTGCTSIRTEQTELALDGTTKTTTITITSLFDSSAKVKGLRATGTEKTQGLTIGEANTEASSSNLVEILIRGSALGLKAAGLP